MSNPIDISVVYVGKTFCVPITLTNTSGVSATDVNVQLQEIPDGLDYLSSSFSRGSYDTVSRIWTIATMSPEEILTGELCFTVTDDSNSPFQFTFIVDVEGDCDGCVGENNICIVADGITCTEIGACEWPIDNHSDVDTTTTEPCVGDRLAWDGSNWVPENNTRQIQKTIVQSTSPVDVSFECISELIGISSELDGWELINVEGIVATKGVTGSTDVNVNRLRGGASIRMLNTPVTIGDEYHAGDGVIDLANDDVLEGDILTVEVVGVHSGTHALGLVVILTFTECATGLQPTPSPTPTPSVTPSNTPTVTPTSSVTPSVTPSITPTSSVTPTASVTPTVTPSTSVTPSVTPSTSVTPSVTPSITPTTSVTPTPTVTPSITPSPSS